ncbi:MAG: hypothetical protein CL920_39535 [Deltaproteobacteria bacterium]|nr:hypothetical protein [Deltaproteobacteria bacterium]MBU54828.1 hypothetical protein [Deltaproteobacteria bacterium]|tara:strand:- start:12399 stop:13142 length:744 start_codon:yes stop_codon:yes gene_type:complete
MSQSEKVPPKFSFEIEDIHEHYTQEISVYIGDELLWQGEDYQFDIEKEGESVYFDTPTGTYELFQNRSKVIIVCAGECYVTNRRVFWDFLGELGYIEWIKNLRKLDTEAFLHIWLLGSAYEGHLPSGPWGERFQNWSPLHVIGYHLLAADPEFDISIKHLLISLAEKLWRVDLQCIEPINKQEAIVLYMDAGHKTFDWSAFRYEDGTYWCTLNTHWMIPLIAPPEPEPLPEELVQKWQTQWEDVLYD